MDNRITEIDIVDVGVDRFNHDHQRLLFYVIEFNKLAKRFHDREPYEDEWDQINAIFPRLENYTKDHFNAEEELFRKHDYPQLEQHCKQHDNLLQNLQNLKNGIEARQYAQITDLDSFLLDWLIGHINRDDLQYRSFFKMAKMERVIEKAMFNEIITANLLNQIVQIAPPDIVLIDVRTDSEHQEGIIPTSQLYPCDHNLEDRNDTAIFRQCFSKSFDYKQFDHTTRYFLICRSGPRTEVALEFFLEYGLMACELIGGIEEWKRQDLPIVAVDSTTPRLR